MQDGLHHLLAYMRLGVVDLRGVVPGKRGAIVAVVDEARCAARMMAKPKNHRGIGLIVVMIFDLDLHA